MEWARTDLLLAAVGLLVFGTGWAIERQLVRIANESAASRMTLESCRVLLKHIAENMQRGERVDLYAEFIGDAMKKALNPEAL